MKRLKLLIFLLITVFSLFRFASQLTLTEEQVKVALNQYIQSMSNDEIFAYQVTSIYKTNKTYLSGETWCIKIDPPIPLRDPSVASTAYFVISFLDPHWSALGFSEHDKGEWLAIGCEDL